MNNNLNDKNNRPNIEDELLDDVADVEIEDLSFDFKGEGTLDGNLTPDESTNEPYINNNNDVSNDVATKDGLGTSSGDLNDMVDTSDDVNAGSSIGSNDNTISDDGSEPSMYDSSKSDTLPQDDMIDTPDDIGDTSDTLNNSDETNDSGNNKKKDDGGSDDSGSNNKEKSNSENDPEKKTSDDNQKDSNGTDKEKKSDSKDNPESNNDKPKDNMADNSKQETSKNNPDNQDNSKPSPNDSKTKNSNKQNDSKNAPQNNKPKNSDKKTSTQSKVNQNPNHRVKNTPESPNLNKPPKNIGKKSPTNINSGRKGVKKLGDVAKKAAKSVGKNVGKVVKKAGKKIARVVASLMKHPIILGIMIGVVLLIIILCIVVPAFGSIFTPGQGNDVKENFSSFSVEDQKIIDEINNEGYKPNAELALFTVAYPYFETLQEGGLEAYLDSDDLSSEEDENSFQQWYSEKKNEILESFGCDELCQDFLGEAGTEQIAKTYFKEYLESKILFWKNDCYTEEGLIGGSCDDNSEQTSSEETSERDPYLTIFRKRKMIEKYAILLEKLSSTSTSGDYSSEDEFFEYLESDYFKDDAGYKALFSQTNRDEQLVQTIIDDIKANASSFSVYIKENCTTSYGTQSLGQITLTNDNIIDIIKGNVSINVHVGEAGCITGNTECGEAGVYSFDRYVQGVVYEELASVTDIEKIKAQMVAAKVFTLNRATISGDAENGYDLYIIWGQAAQDFCDIYDGCENAAHGDSSLGHGANRAPASAEMQELYKQAWEETKGVYIIEGEEESGKLASVHYMNGCPSDWICLEQSNLLNNTYDGKGYQDILSAEYDMNANDLAYLMVEGDYFSGELVTLNRFCSENTSGGIPDSEFKFYYQTDYPDVAFCGADTSGSTQSSDDDFISGCKSEGGKNSICTSGCGVTSYAMIIATLSDTEGSFDPIAANNEATSSGGCAVGSGTNNSLFTGIANNHTGFTVEQIPVTLDGANQVLDVLRNGGVVVANVQAQSPFTDGGHWIVIRGVTSDGEVKVADPNSESRSTTGVYNINDFINNNWLVDDEGTTHSWFAIYGPRSDEFKYTAGDGVATGFLTSPLGVNQTNEDAIKAVGSNSKTLYYASGGYHGGIDFPLSSGTEVYAMDGGIVERSENKGAYGNYIIIEHTIDGKIYYTLYAHLSQRNVSNGDEVSQGQLIGLSGNTGNSSGPHLHAELINSINCLGHTCSGVHYNILNYIGLNKSYVGQSCDGEGC